MASNLNYEKQIFIHNKSEWMDDIYFKHLKSKPTVNQISYCKFLLELCEKNNVKGCKPSHFDNRASVAKAINIMKKNLIDAGVDVNAEHTKKKRKYRFDQHGNVVEIATGKIVKRRDGKTDVQD